MAEPATQNQDLSDLRFPKPSPGSSGEGHGIRPVDLPGFVHSPHSVPPVGTIPPDHQLPEETYSGVNAGEIVGAALRRTIDRARQLSEVAQERLSDARARMEVLRSRVSEDAKEKAADLRDAAQDQLQVARIRMKRITDERPLQFIAGAAAAAFVIGFVLGVWRDPRD